MDTFRHGQMGASLSRALASGVISMIRRAHIFQTSSRSGNSAVVRSCLVLAFLAVVVLTVSGCTTVKSIG